VINQIENLQRRIQAAALSCGRQPDNIRLVAVTKTVGPEKIKTAIAAGIHIFGENYIQEAKNKIEKISDDSIKWHFIGHLQSNKAKFAIRFFDLIHSVDSFKLAREINKQAKKYDKVQNILIQINISKEETKSGIAENEAISLLRDISNLENVSVKGLMTMPPFFNQPEKVRSYFKALAELRNKIKAVSILNIFMDELSMGMTGDFEVAISEGATLVRIGTAIFGERL